MKKERNDDHLVRLIFFLFFHPCLIFGAATFHQMAFDQTTIEQKSEYFWFGWDIGDIGAMALSIMALSIMTFCIVDLIAPVRMHSA